MLSPDPTLNGARFYRYRFIVLILLFFFRQAYALDYFPITHLGIEQGLSNNSVRCIYQDRKGFIWFGTYDGLNRYDGYEFKTFRNKLNDSSSLPHNYIYAISEDRHNNIWVGTGQGIGVYDPLTSKFHSAWYRPYGWEGRSRIRSDVNCIRTDAAGNIFIGTNGRGLLFFPEGATEASQLPCKNGKESSPYYNVQAIVIDRDKQVWLFILNIGLCRFDYANREIRVINPSIRDISSMESDNTGNLWMGTVRGVYQYSIAGNSVVRLYNSAVDKLSSDNVTSLFMDRQRNLWIGTEGGGLNILRANSGKVDYLLPGESKNALTSESVYAVYEDNESRKWIATLKGGIDLIDPQKNLFQTIAHDPLDRNSLVNNFVSCFYEDGDKDLWIGTDGGGMSIWNRRQHKFVNFIHTTGDQHSLSNNSVSCILQDYLNTTWISTFGGGINKFNKRTGSFEHFGCINELTGEENKNVCFLYEDRLRNLWATTFANGKLYRFNRKAGRFVVFDQDLSDLIAIMEDRDSVLWAGNSHQLVKIDRQNKKHIFYEIGKPVRAIYEDKEGRFWIGTEGGGLSLFDRRQGKVTARYADENGLCNNSVLNILEGDNGQLWLSTFNGLSGFDPGRQLFRNFYQSDGLQSSQFNFNAALRLRSGELAFGGIKGFNLFYPDSIRSRSYMPPVRLTDIRVNNRTLNEVNGYVVKSGDGQMDGLRVPYNEALLSFNFAALEYSSPGKIHYAYYLQGWDKTWNYTENIRTINYNNIREGAYLLHIRSTNAEGIWNPAETMLNITVLPPWYRAWWAFLLYSLLAIALIYTYIYYKMRQNRLEYQVKLVKLHSEKEKEVNERKLSFFTHVSHEFRTPLMLIINPLKEVFQRTGELSNSAELKIVFRNARRLLSLVDQLLLFNKAESGGNHLKISGIDFYTLCKQAYDSFVYQAKNKNISYLFDMENLRLELFGDREKLEVILYNLLSNAFKYTPAGGSISFRVKESESEIELSISDTGIGISPETGNALFDKFYRANDKEAQKKAGFGIGLYLVKHFADLHGARISYSSQLGSGATFELHFKKGHSHFAGLAIEEKTGEEPVFLEELAAEQEVMPSTPAVAPSPGKSMVSDGSSAGSFKEASGPLHPFEGSVTNKHSMLMIDDNSDMREYLGSIFTDKFILYDAGNAEDGLLLARQYIPDIIISDIMMDGQDGIQLCKSIKDNPSLNHIPIILITASPSDQVKLKGIEGGADDYITKPFEKEMIAARVATLLRNRNNLQKYFYNEVTHKRNTLKISAEDKAFIDRCIAIVESHIEDDDFNIVKLSAEIGMSHSNLYKKIKSVSSLSINGFVRFIRLRKAAELFINTNQNVNEVAVQVGFNDMKYFREQFYKLFGVNPSDYIKKFRPGFSKNLTINPGITKK